MNIAEFAKKYHGLVLQPHQLEWIRFIESAGMRCILLAPRGHGKSTTLNQVYLSWVIANNPGIRILFVSHSKEMAESFSRTIRNIMENEELQEEFQINRGTPWRANSWTLRESPQSKPTLECKGAMGRMAGWRGDMVVFDDLLETNTVASESMMKKIENWIKTDVLPAINPSPLEKVVVVGTRKHIHDWYGQLLKNPSYAQKTDKAINPDGSTLWPAMLDENGQTLVEMYTAERLESKKREIGPLLFAQEYMNEPAPPEGLEFKYEWLQFYEHLPNVPLRYYMGVDPSSGKKTDRTQSYFSYCVVAHDAVWQDKVYVVEMFRGKLSKGEQVEKSVEAAMKYMPAEMYIEDVFEYTHVYDAMRATFSNVFPIDYIHTPIKGTNVVKKEERIRNIVGPAVEQGRLLFRKSDLDDNTRVFIEEEYVPFPIGSTDMLDALTLAIHSLVGESKITSVPFYFPV